MTATLVLADHRALQQAALRTAAVGGLGGLLCALAPGPLSAALALTAMGLSIAPPRSMGAAARVALLASVVPAVALLPGPVGVALAAALGGALYVDGGGRAARSLLAWAFGAAALAAAWFVAGALGGEVLDGAAPALVGLLAGAGGGLCAGLGVVGGQITWAHPQLDDSGDERGAEVLTTRIGRVASLPPLPGLGSPAGPPAPVAAPPSPERAEFEALVARAADVGRRAAFVLRAGSPEAARAAGDLVARIGGVAARWRELDGQLAGVGAEDLTARLAELALRARDASDEEVRREYARAERVVRQQIEDLAAIRGWQARALARLHHHVAVLERLRLAALHRSSADAGRAGGDLGALVEELAGAGLEIDGETEVLAALPHAG